MNRLKKIFLTLFKKNQRNMQLEESTIPDLISELEDLHIKKQRMNHYLDEINIKEEAYKEYAHLDEETIRKINQLLQRSRDIEERKQNLKGRLISNNAALNRLSAFEDDLPNLIKEMQVAEKRRRETESHIIYLQDERQYLVDERETLIGGYRFLKGFSLLLVVLMGVCLLTSFIMLQVLRERIWMVLSGIVVVVLLSVVGIILIKDNLEKQIKTNEILQQKAAKYLNKSKIRFFNQTQYLEFQYRKLGVDSVAKLELYYNRYLKNRHNEQMYIKLNRELTQVEAEVGELLPSLSKGIQDWWEVAEWALHPKQLKEGRRLSEERTKTEEQVQALTLYEEEIWLELRVLAAEEEKKLQINALLRDFKGENRLDKAMPSA